MPWKLKHDDRKRLTSIVENMNGFGDASDRRTILAAALGQSPRALKALNSIVTDGSPDVVSRRVILGLENFGQLEDGIESLELFLTEVIERVDISQQAMIKDIINRCKVTPETVRPDLALRPGLHGRGVATMVVILLAVTIVVYNVFIKPPKPGPGTTTSTPPTNKGLIEKPPKPGPGTISSTPPTNPVVNSSAPIKTPLVENPKSIGMTLKLITPGDYFWMGADDLPGTEEKPRHKVKISKPYYIGETEVTQGQFIKLMAYNNGEHVPHNDKPIENVSWNEAADFCNRLSSGEGKTPFYERTSRDGDFVPVPGGPRNGYRLPTEAEWEFACRGPGSGDPKHETKYCFGDDPSILAEYAFRTSTEEGPTKVKTCKVNGWGLYDMHGNVFEWCENPLYKYPDGTGTDPMVPINDPPLQPDPKRPFIARGGAYRAQKSDKFVYDAATPKDRDLEWKKQCRSAFRHHMENKKSHWNAYGFRVARTAD